MTGERIEEIIKEAVKKALDARSEPGLPADIVATDNIGEVIEKLSILHCRTWHLEDAAGSARTDEELADIKRKIDICFKQKRPKYVEAINRMIENSIVTGRSLVEDSVKMYRGHERNA